MIVFLTGFFVAFAFVIHMLVIPAYHKKKTTSAEGMIGLEGKVIETLRPNGLIRVKGEYWKAKSVGKEVEVSENVEIVGLDGLTLRVKNEEQPMT